MLVIGHRGARAEAPENTLGGFRHLRSLGILRVELDIQVARNGELVVIHDTDLQRTTGQEGNVHDFTALELAAMDACHLHFPSWPVREGIPDLVDVMRELQDFEHIQFEVKATLSSDVEAVVAQLPGLIRHFNLIDRCISTSFNPLYLQALRQDAPEIQRGLLFDEKFPGNPVELAQRLGCLILGPQQQLCAPPLIQAAHAAGLIISTWTVNDPERMRELASWGIHSLITDQPTLALNTLVDCRQPALG
ncbi:MAG: glycerophosphodiester phosphodiesterase [Pseudomonadales bacterium]|nr:glycerophosphodiester phosphodiesterase [Pseudomonadales bacterium]